MVLGGDAEHLLAFLPQNEFFIQEFQVMLDAQKLHHQVLPVPREGYAPPLAGERGDAVSLFDLLDGLGYTGLGHKQLSGRGADGATLCRCGEIPDLL